MNCCRPNTEKTVSTEGTYTPKEEGQDETEKAERNFESDIRELFQLFDTDNSKTLSALELGKAMMFLGMSPTDEEVEIAMKVLDVNGTGKIKFQEFFTFIKREMSKVNDGYYTTKEDVIRLAFQTFDKEGNGFVDENELRTALKTMGECLTDREFDDMMKLAHVDDDGKVDYEEFIQAWCRRR
ncbi:calmodulin-beta-like [Ruditapes philippinarum]|uniref:calmodulin-beta-like n=1 Tax=Ruditapes philippinarum TaxID=129788 RepID=UPI00295C0ABD|nr:calmodulin-beta-like [Ruditapes philippinarum]XP_060557353.1 calmodulin-beta-like [Ruditapes philippinarum]XP_060557354.1 calmodulin-beta-like [Ruditapes philippinarum]XP_060557355.1 calmodulin-beta-like [Ruditapes philippinarum]XP_060557356.1 calmodulin-beta-like [Ruditapes philippinarum]